jgi:hypothetical protein
MPRDHTFVNDLARNREAARRKHRLERERRSKNCNAACRRQGYYAPVDGLGRLLLMDGLEIMTYNELQERTRDGYLSSGLLLEQADLAGNSVGVYRLEIREGKPILKEER